MSRFDDAELIAKLLEGKATPQEREAILKRADADPGLLHALAVSAEHAVAGSRMWRRATPWLMAVILIFAVAFPIAMRGRGPIPPLNRGLLDARAWVDAAVVGAARPTLRGDATSTRLVRSAELGARVTDLEVLTRAGHPGAAAIVLELAAAARAIPGGAVAASRFDALGAASDSVARRAAVTALASILDGVRFRAGEWAEAARLASVARDEAFLRSPSLRDAVARTARNSTLPAEARESAARLGATLAATPVDAAAAERAVAELLASLSR